MRTRLLFLLGISLVGCKWTDFDDLEDDTWVRSTEDPDLGATDYAVAIAGVSTSSSGGMLAVVSDDTPNYSTIDYNSAGGADVGANPVKLGTQNIGALAESPVFISEPSTGRIGLVERSINGGNFAILFGSPTAPAGLELMSAETPTPAPDAAVFVNSDLVFAAGDTLYTIPAAGGMAIPCSATDHMNMPLQVAGMAADASTLWVWTKGGALLGYPLAALNPCNGGSVPAPGANAFTVPGGFMPGAGAKVHIEGTFAILAGRATTSRTGQVFVVDLTNLTQVGTTLTVEGLRSSVVASFDGITTYLAIGVPDQTVESVVAGQVQLHEYNPATGELAAAPAETLYDADPESGQQFGRTITTMPFNGSPILVVGADAEVFAYYRTALYDHLP